MYGKSNFSQDVEPYTLDIVYGHIQQLAPVVARNADVIHALQAGFLGNAGEWAHDIRGFVSNRTGLARMVAIELYNLLPPDRAVLIRRPLEKREWLLASLPAQRRARPPLEQPASRPRRPSAPTRPPAAWATTTRASSATCTTAARGAAAGRPAARRPRPLLLVHDGRGTLPANRRRGVLRYAVAGEETKPVDGHAAAGAAPSANSAG